MNTTGWTLKGEAAVKDKVFTDKSELLLCSAKQNTSGAVFFNQPINLSICNRWKAEFDFRMNDGTAADGIAFNFLDAPPTGFVLGQGLGIPSGANGLKICFDTYNNCTSPSSAKVPKIEIRYGPGYDECWNQPTLENVNNSLSFIRSATYNHAVISYDNGQISVSVNGTVLLTANQSFNFAGYLGFTASTGASTDNHSIRNVIIYTDMPPSEAGSNLTSTCNVINANIGTSPISGYTYSWSPATGLSNPNIANPLVQLTNNTGTTIQQKYYVKTSFASNPGCYSVDSVLVQVNPKPTVTFTGPLPAVCTNTTPFTLTAGSPAGGVYSGPGITGATFSPSIAGVGTHILTYTYTNAQGCTNAATTSIRVNAFTQVIAANDVSICKGNTIALTATNAVSYQWTPSTGLSATTGSSVNASPITSTVYIVTGTDANACKSSDQIVVTVFNPPSATISYGAGSLCGSTPVPVTITGSTGGTFSAPAGLSIQASTGTIFPAASSSGNYTISYTVSNGSCSVIAQTSVNIKASPSVSFNNVLPSVCFYGAAFSITGGSPAGGTYSGPGITGATFNPSVAGRGTHTITYAYTKAGCTNTATNTISVYPMLLVTASSPVAVCTGGTVMISATNASTYTWSPSTGLSSTIGAVVSASPLTTTTYTVTGIENGSGCSSQDQVTVSVLSAPTASIRYSGSPYCTAGNASVTQTGLSGGTYQSSAGLQINSLTGLIDLATSTPGTYTVTYTFSNGGCGSFTQTSVVILPPPSVTLRGFSPVCLTSPVFSLSGGLPSGGVYSGPGIAAGTFSPATAGKGIHTITYTYTNGSGCIGSATNVIVVNPLTPVAVITDQTICYGASVSLTVTEAISYEWMPGSLSGNQISVNPLTNTSYTVTGTHADGCTSAASVLVNVIPAPVANIAYAGSPFCNQGTASVMVSGQTGGVFTSTTGLQIDTNTGEINLAASSPASYIIRYTFSNGICSSFTETNITILPPPTVSYSNPTPVVCSNIVPFTLSGGFPLTGIYSGAGVVSGIFNPIIAGRGNHEITYTYTSAQGCVNSATQLISVQPLVDVSAGSDITICAGTAAIITASNAVLYNWSPSSSLSSTTGAVVTANPLTQTTYYVTGTDAAGCTSTDQVVVSVLPLPDAIIQYSASVFCNTGNITPIISGTVGGIFSANAGLWIDIITGEIDLSKSTPGSYTVTYSFSDGSCSNQTFTQITIVAPTAVSFALPVSSVCVSAAAFSITGGSPLGGVYSGPGISGASFSPSVAGTGVHVLSYMYTDAGGCVSSATASLTVNPLISVQAGSDVTVCLGSSVSLTAINGTSYSWSPNQYLSGTTGAMVVASPLTTTTYTVTGMDTYGCSSSDMITVQVLPLPTATISYAGNPFCKTGSVGVNRTGVGGGVYSSTAGLIINAGTGVIDLSASTPGSYTVTYSFSDGSCSNQTFTQITIVAPTAVSFALPVSSVCVSAAAFSITGGSPLGGVYSGPGISGASFSPSVAGTGVHVLSYMYTDAGGCVSSATASLTVNPLISVQAGSDVTVCLGSSVSLTAINGTSYSWSPNQYLSGTTGAMVVASPLTTTTYTVTGMDTYGCSSSDMITVQVLPLPTATISYAGNPFCKTGSVGVNRTGVGGGVYSSTAGLIINAGTGVIDLSASTPGSYTVTYSFTSGKCSAQVSTQVTIFDLPIVRFNNVFPSVCVQGSPFSLVGGSPSGGVYRGPGIKGDVLNPSLAGVGTHVIEYTYTNTKGCAAMASTTITITAVSNGNTNLSFPEVCVNANPFTLIVPAGISGGGIFSGNGVTGNTFDPQKAGVGKQVITYTTNAVSGCSIQYTGIIQVNPKPALQVVAPSKVCEGSPVVINPIATGELFWSDSSGKLNQITSNLVFKATRSVSYLITCRDGKGCTNSQPVNIDVDPVPDARFNYSSNTFCAGGTATVLLAGLSGGSFSADPGLSIQSSTGQIDLSASSPGNHTILYRVANATGCISTHQLTITLKAAPTLSLSNLLLCSGSMQAITTTGIPAGSSWVSGNASVATVDANGVVQGLQPGQTFIRFTNNEGCTSNLSVNVRELPRLSGKQLVCKRDSIIIVANTQLIGSAGFISQNPAIASVSNLGIVRGERAGRATIEFRDQVGCSVTHVIQVDSVPERLPAPALTCEPATIRLDQPMLSIYGNSGYTFTYWKDSSKTSLLNNPMRISESGMYYVQVNNANGCGTEKPVKLKVSIARAVPAKRLDTIRTQNNVPIQLKARAIGTQYRWSPAAGLNTPTIRDPWFSYMQNMEYQIAIRTDSGCLVTDTVFVKAVDANIFVPSGFTPNTDGKNDKFAPVCFSIARINFFSVFNRWGELLFTTNTIGKGWDGTYKGSPSEPGTYVWMLEAIGMDGQVFRQKGTVVLIR